MNHFSDNDQIITETYESSYNQLRLEHLNSEEKELITNLCLEVSDIFFRNVTN